jgi:hypothetical protein
MHYFSLLIEHLLSRFLEVSPSLIIQSTITIYLLLLLERRDLVVIMVLQHFVLVLLLIDLSICTICCVLGGAHYT